MKTPSIAKPLFVAIASAALLTATSDGAARLSPPPRQQASKTAVANEKPTLNLFSQLFRSPSVKHVQPVKPVSVQTGTASWYGEPQRTATGARFQPDGLTAAHRRLPLGTVVRVTNLKNKRQTTVKINDRGPYIKGRILDLSRGAARELAMINSGTAKVLIEVLPPSAG